jgi:Tol biopolymer transport system component
LAFTRTGTYIGGAPELFTVAPDGSHARRELTADALQGGSPSISPDARTVIVTNHSPRSRVEVIDLASGARRILAETPDSAPSTFLLHPAWSRDGRFVAMTVQSDTAILRVMDREGRVQVERDVDGDPQGLSWSPDGRQLAFCQSVPDPSRGRFFTRQEIVVWTLQTGLLRTITPQGASDCFPSWTR